MLDERVRRRRDHPFLLWEPAPGDGPRRTWSYGEFHRDVEATAAGLAARGVTAGDTLIIHLDNSPAFLHLWFACGWLGAVAVDVNTRYAEDELAHAIALTGAVAIVTDPRLGAVGTAAAAGLRWVARLDPKTGTVPDGRPPGEGRIRGSDQPARSGLGLPGLARSIAASTPATRSSIMIRSWTSRS
ncbi:AMP-binding enzyme [Parafrankia irregularis]|uniref:AMP-binding enzyme n=2 Tax=Frankiaceae TaxID=74712 RepID=A0A0S4QR36_9ACTN|nr:AMP-binding protein [Parafrankia sp. CH37]CUU58203.1 AMP-binding enzyme [Parafrankia irregularis]